jgi:heat shock protein HtpX
MAIAKRVILFGIVNLLVVLTISIVLSVAGVRPYLARGGLDYGSLMVYCLVWGLFGSFVSLALSRVAAKWMMGVQVIDPTTASGDAAWLVQTVHGQARSAGISVMPEVGVYNSPEVNAFATGPTRNRALVAVSSGLMQSMDRAQVEGVLGHEVSHVANGDMVTMTLLQGVINAFVMFIARVIGFVLAQRMEKESARRTVQFLATFILEILLSFLGMMVVSAFSRWREYRADAGGARLAGREKMVSALEGLRRASAAPRDDRAPTLAAFKISNRPGGIQALFSTHPPLEARIARLQQGAF